MSLDVYLTTEDCPLCKREGEELFWQNITHNLTEMAAEGGIYEIVWRPELNGIERAGQLIEPLAKAISDMEAEPARFMEYDSDNGWGTYKDFLPWLKKYLEACRKWPEAIVRVSR